MSVRRINSSDLRRQSGQTIDIDQFGVWRVSTPYRCPYEKLESSIPSPLASHPDFSFCKLSGIGAVEEEGEDAFFTANYAGLKTSESVHQVRIIPGTTDDPVETNKLFKDLTQDEHKYIRDYIQEPKGVVTVYDLSSAGLLLLLKKLSGIDSFINQGITLQDTYYRSSAFANIPEIAIASPAVSGTPELPEGHNWLFIPGEQSQEGGVFRVTDEYRASGPLGWDVDLYT